MNALRQYIRDWTRQINWADKAALFVAGALAVLLVAGWILALIALSSFDYLRFDAEMLRWSLFIELGVTLPFWGLMRLIDMTARALLRAERNLRAQRATSRAYPIAIKSQLGWR